MITLCIIGETEAGARRWKLRGMSSALLKTRPEVPEKDDEEGVLERFLEDNGGSESRGEARVELGASLMFLFSFLYSGSG